MHGMRSVLGPSFLLLAAVTAACGGDQTPPATPSPAATPSATTPPPVATSADTDGGAAAPTSTATANADGPWPFGSSEDRATQLDRLKANPGPIKSNWSPPGQADRYGHAEGLIGSPPDKVRAKLTDYNHYNELAGPKFKSVKVVNKEGANTDVYFQLPIMKGAVVIWYVTRFAPPKTVSTGDVIDGTFVKGNIKGMHLAWSIRPGPDTNSSVMMCDLVLQLSVPAPQSALDEELRDACGDAINSLKKKLAP